VGGAPLLDGQYAILVTTEFSGRAILEVIHGNPFLTGQEGDQGKTLPLGFVGAGPLWHLLNKDSKDQKFAAELLVLDENRSWIFVDGMDHGLEISRMQDVPVRLQGHWTSVPNIFEGKYTAEALQLSQTGAILYGQGGLETKFSANWLQHRKDAWPHLIAAVENEGAYLPMVEQNGLLGVLFPDDGLQLFVKKQAAAPQALTLEHLKKRLFLYRPDGKAHDLKCHAEDCDLLELDAPSDPVHWKAVADWPAFAVRLRAGNSDSKELVLVSMANRVLAAGPQNMVALTP
jgi:hypothetical protein